MIPDYSTVLAAVRKAEAEPGSGPQVVVDIHRNCTVDQIIPYLKFFMHSWGLRPVVRQGDFDTVASELFAGGLGGDSQAALIILHAEMLFSTGQEECVDPEATLARLDALLDVVAQQKRLIALTNFACGRDVRTPTGLGGIPALIECMNQRVAVFVEQHSHCRLLDLAGIAADLGDARWLDRRNWFRFKAPFRVELLAHLARQAANVLADSAGKAKKCLVLDCDETLWGGIVGEAGVEGIALDPHSYPGNAYYAFQRTIRDLQHNGVMLALLSKNNEADALEVLERHPHCLIRKSHLVGWRIDWNPKSENLRALAQQLNIGLDSIVYVDDSDLECGLMRQELPQVTTLQVPKDRTELPTLLADAALFPRRRATGEDKRRATLYQQENQRQSEREKHRDLSAFLASLGMEAAIGKVLPHQVARTAQLLARTNQFMLTDLRPSEGEISNMLADPARACYVFSLKDRFGDLGLVGAMVLRRVDDDTASLEAMAVSCRALGRSAEDVFFNRVMQAAAQSWGVSRIVGRYVPSAKNHQVADLLPRYGLLRTEGEVFAAPLSDLTVRAPDYIKVTDNG